MSFSVFVHSSDSPVLWVRIDPEVTWLRQVTFEQPDYMWQYQLRHERDVIAQSEVSLHTLAHWFKLSWIMSDKLVFIPCHRKYSQSEYKKSTVYWMVLHPTFSLYNALILLAISFFMALRTYLSLLPLPVYSPLLRHLQNLLSCTFASSWFQVMPIFLVSARRSQCWVFLGLPLLPFPLGVPR